MPTHGRRLVLRPPIAVERFTAVAYVLGWMWWDTIEESDDGPCETIFLTRDNKTSIHFVDDSFTATCFLVFKGEEPEKAFETAEQRFPSHSEDDIVTAAREAEETETRIRGILALAVIASQADRSAVVDIVRAASVDSEPMVRRASIVAMSYVGWPEFRAVAADMQRSDADPEIREDAAALVEGYALQEQGLL